MRPENERGEPDRIYLQIHGDSEAGHCGPEHPWGEVTWCRDRAFDSDVEYVRADRAVPNSHAGIERVIAAVRVHLKRTTRHHQAPHDARLKAAYIASRDRLAEMTGLDVES